MNYVERLAVIKRDMNAILDVAETEKRGLTPEEQEQFDALKNERDRAAKRGGTKKGRETGEGS